jgi:hypothetical protein
LQSPIHRLLSHARSSLHSTPSSSWLISDSHCPPPPRLLGLTRIGGGLVQASRIQPHNPNCTRERQSRETPKHPPSLSMQLHPQIRTCTPVASNHENTNDMPRNAKTAFKALPQPFLPASCAAPKMLARLVDRFREIPRNPLQCSARPIQAASSHVRERPKGVHGIFLTPNTSRLAASHMPMRDSFPISNPTNNIPQPSSTSPRCTTLLAFRHALNPRCLACNSCLPRPCYLPLALL